MIGQLVDPVPVVGVFLIFTVIALATFEIGFRAGRYAQQRTPDVKEGPNELLAGSLLALFAFLLAVTMGMASDRFDSRRALVLEEANAIGTTYLRAAFLDPEAETAVRETLREYVLLRVNDGNRETVAAKVARSVELLDEIWPVAVEQGRRHDSESVALFIESLNETIDVQAARTTALQYARVPETVLILLFIGEALTMAIVGFNAGLTGKRAVLSALALVLILGAVLMIVVDLDRPREGFLQVSQQPLIDLAREIGPP